MRSYNCTPVSYPSLPACYQHPMWEAWDLALDHIIGQLPALVEGKATYEVLLMLVPCSITLRDSIFVAQQVLFSAVGCLSGLATKLL